MPKSSTSTKRGFAQKPAGIDRRAQVRYCIDRLTYFTLVASPWPQTWCQATVQDIAASGIGLILGQRLAPGTLLSIDLDGVCRLLLCRVIHARSEGTGTWRVGCQFVGQLNEEELQALLRGG